LCEGAPRLIIAEDFSYRAFVGGRRAERSEPLQPLSLIAKTFAALMGHAVYFAATLFRLLLIGSIKFDGMISIQVYFPIYRSLFLCEGTPCPIIEEAFSYRSPWAVSLRTPAEGRMCVFLVLLNIGMAEYCKTLACTVLSKPIFVWGHPVPDY